MSPQAARETPPCPNCEVTHPWRDHTDPQAESALTDQPDLIRSAVRLLGPAGTLAEGIVQQAALAHAEHLDALRAGTPHKGAEA